MSRSIRPSIGSSLNFRLLLWCMGAATVAYALHAIYAIATYRHLYGDAAWFLLKVISDGLPTHFYDDFATQFYFSRFVAYWLTQLPTVIAVHLGVTSNAVLSWILGATYFGHRLASLALCWRIAGRTNPFMLLFPLFGLFAGTINSDIYIVTEIHIAASFLWPIALYLTLSLRRDGIYSSLAVFGILVAAFTYEAWAFLAPLLALGLFWLGRVDKARKQPVAIYLALAFNAAINWAAILFPRDPTNKDGFVKGILGIIDDSFAPGRWHVTDMVSFLVIGWAFLVVIAPSRFVNGRVASVLAGALALVALILPAAYLRTHRADLDLTYAITDRGFSGLVTQFALLVIYLLLVCRPSASLTRPVGQFAVVLVGLAVGQIAWQGMATAVWSKAEHAVRDVAMTGKGIVPCQSMDAAARSRRALPSTIMCSWWVTPLSVLLAPDRHVQAIISSPASFKPFNLLDPSKLPGRQVIDYSGYISMAGPEPRPND
ncbi:hypothetical protein [Pinirhizobacter soli]|uniref:hypothetical protein n=1 Tax=Pinirhizobacter soli TaxID=2786953 RepID=UPI00202A78E4|nr:hypothetical protein [Pinirhizobacter soli]